MDDNDQNLPVWLRWAREIQSIAQTGDHYAKNEFQRMRYARLQEIAAEMISQQSTLEFGLINYRFNVQVGYATPKVDVRGAVFQDGNLLLVQERIDKQWTMPGGWADVGETPSQSVEREVFEESGLQVKAYRLVGIYDANRTATAELVVFHAYKIIFLCEVLGGDLSISNETMDAKFFSQEAFPRDLSRLRTDKHHIEDAFAAFEDSNYIPVFD